MAVVLIWKCDDLIGLSLSVHCRKRKTDHGLLKDPSSSSNTYWQIEKESDPRSGEPLSWGERCRIRHMPTRCYLAVLDGSNEVQFLQRCGG